VDMRRLITQEIGTDLRVIKFRAFLYAEQFSSSDNDSAVS
jgi:hypothetical protein